LKILSRITEPTSGEARIRGRVASLLEVGTGFHPELSGRENIFLNGAILGMTKTEIRSKFDEIVAFAEIEKFIDTPVKRYSSGMYVRLAFAVAAHLEPEILIVDEVLAVGDSEFQKKCLGKMHEVSDKDGRTVLFVSHNMDAVSQLCSSAILLRHGRLEKRGPTDDVLREYLEQGATQRHYMAPSDKKSGIIRVTTRTPEPKSANLTFEIIFKNDVALKNPTLGVTVFSAKGSPVFGSNTLFHPWSNTPRFGATGSATVTFRDLALWTGTYRASFWLSEGTEPVDMALDAVTFEVVSDHLPTNAPSPRDIGHMHVRGEWTPKS
jgi:lipopolysaccharide transport system ATP-binding protein